MLERKLTLYRKVIMSRLPVDPNRCEFRRIEYGPRDWDQTPRISTIREIDRLLPDISRLAANIVTREADVNVIRTVHFNLVAENEFVNLNFDRLVQFIADFIELRLADRQIRDAAQGLEDSIAAAVTLHATSMVDQFKELDDIIQDSRNRDFIRAVDTNVGRFRTVIESIEAMHNEDQGHVRDSYSERSHRDDRRRDYRDSGSERSSRDDRSYGRNGSSERSYGRSDRDRRGRDDRSYAPQRETVNPNYNEDDFVSEEPKKPEGRYNLTKMQADDPIQEKTAQEIVDQHRLSGRMMDDRPMFKGIYGSIPLLIPPNGMSEMDMFKHARIYGGDVADAQDMSAEIVRVFTAAQAVNEDNVTAESIENEVTVNTDIKLFSNVSTMCESVSLDATLNSIENAGDNLEGKRELYHTTAVVDNAVIGYQHLNDFQKNLAECKSMKDIMDYLKRARDAINTHASPEAAFATDLRAAVDIFDRVITKEVNAYCRDVLRISDGDTMASAVDSLDNLVMKLHEAKQDNLQNALIAFLSRLTTNILDCLDPKNKSLESIRLANGITDEDVGIAFLPQSYIVSHIPFTMRELGYTIKEPVAIDDTQISSFLRAAIDISKTSLAKDPKYAESHRLIVTRDRSAFRLYNYPGRKDVIVLAPVVIN